LQNNAKASDFSCPNCGFWYQLKGQKTAIRNTITDGAYETMMEAIRSDRAPNYYFMHYDLSSWTIRNLLLVPHFAFPASAIIKRKPLAESARRAGWVGCNFALDRIPIDARIDLVKERVVLPASEVRQRFKKVKKLQELPVSLRGWTLDVLNIVRRLEGRGQERGARPSRPQVSASRRNPIGSERETRSVATGTVAVPAEFKNADVYAFERELEKLHPGNRHIRDKIRQQLQVLRDQGFLVHAGRNRWQTV
jgi:type II restriction enzyme